jgi:hypothetical protein
MDQKRRMRRVLGIVAITVPSLLIVAMLIVSRLENQAVATMHAVASQDAQEFAFVGGLMAEICPLADATEQGVPLKKLTDSLTSAIGGVERTETLRRVVSAYATASELTVRNNVASGADSSDVARAQERATMLLDSGMRVAEALPTYDPATVEVKNRFVEVFQRGKASISAGTIRPGDAQDLNSDIGRLGSSLEASFSKSPLGQHPVQVFSPLVWVYLGLWHTQIPVISGIARDRVTAILSDDVLDKALRASSAFEEARSHGCLSSNRRLFDALEAVLVRLYGPSWMQRISKPFSPYGDALFRACLHPTGRPDQTPPGESGDGAAH